MITRRQLKPVLDPSLLARLSALSFRSRRLIEGSLSGLHRSQHRGASVEFAEHKEYAPGDNLRHIDWRVYAKSDKYYVKEFEAETNLRATLVIDASASMAYGSKFSFAAELCSALAFILLRQQDAVGLAVVTGRGETVVPARTRATHLRAILDLLSRATPSGAGDMSAPIREILDSNRRRGLVVIASDLLDQPEDLQARLGQLRARGHEVILFHTLDGTELTFPFTAPHIMESLEDDRRILVEPAEIRTAYLAEVAAFIESWRRFALDADIDYVVTDVSRGVSSVLVDFLLARDRAA